MFKKGELLIYDNIEDGVIDLQTEIGLGYFYILEWNDIIKIGCSKTLMLESNV